MNGDDDSFTVESEDDDDAPAFSIKSSTDDDASIFSVYYSSWPSLHCIRPRNHTASLHLTIETTQHFVAIISFCLAIV